MTPFHAKSPAAAVFCAVQVIPSVEVITRFPTPELATATNFSDPAGPPQVTDCQLLFAAEDRAVQLTPSTEVITRFPVPDAATATYTFDPAGPP